MQPAQRRAPVRSACGGEQFGRGLCRPLRAAVPEPQHHLGTGRVLGVVRDAVEEGVGALVREVADGGGVDPGLQHPFPDAVEAEGGQPDHAVAGDVLVVGLGLLAVTAEQRLVHRQVLDDPDGFEDTELVVEPHHRLRDLLQHLVGRLVHVVGDDHGRGEGGQRHGGRSGAGLREGQQVQVAEYAVEELRLGLRVPVQGVEVDAAVLVDEVGEVVEGRCGGVGVHGVQAVEPDPEDVLR